MWQAEAVISRHGALGEIREAPDGSCHLWGMLEIVRHPLFSSQPFDYVCFYPPHPLQASRNLVLPRSKTRRTISGVKSPSCPATQHLPPAIQKTSKPLQIPSSNLASTSSHILPAWPTYRQPTVLCSTEPTESSPRTSTSAVREGLRDKILRLHHPTFIGRLSDRTSASHPRLLLRLPCYSRTYLSYLISLCNFPSTGTLTQAIKSILSREYCTRPCNKGRSTSTAV